MCFSLLLFFNAKFKGNCVVIVILFFTIFRFAHIRHYRRLLFIDIQSEHNAIFRIFRLGYGLGFSDYFRLESQIGLIR